MAQGNDYLVYDSNRTESIGVRVVTYREENGLSFYAPPVQPPRRNFLPLSRLLKEQDRERQVKQVCLHHDGHDSANDTFRTLIHRGLSTHLIIDWEGTVWRIGGSNPLHHPQNRVYISHLVRHSSTVSRDQDGRAPSPRSQAVRPVVVSSQSSAHDP